jgi:hypothetical protein
MSMKRKRKPKSQFNAYLKIAKLLERRARIIRGVVAKMEDVLKDLP